MSDGTSSTTYSGFVAGGVLHQRKREQIICSYAIFIFCNVYIFFLLTRFFQMEQSWLSSLRATWREQHAGRYLNNRPAVGH